MSPQLYVHVDRTCTLMLEISWEIPGIRISSADMFQNVYKDCTRTGSEGACAMFTCLVT